MPSLKLSKLVRRDPNSPSLKQRVASLKATAGRVVHPGQPATADAELLALDAEYEEASKAYCAASDRLEEIESAYTAPPMPNALRVHRNDWIFTSIPRPPLVDLGNGTARELPYGKKEVEHLRAHPCIAVYIGGEEGELQPDGITRLRSDKSAQVRADAIVAAWDEWQGEVTAAGEAAGLPAAEAAMKATSDRRFALLARIRDTRAMSLSGLAVKARLGSPFLDLRGQAAKEADEHDGIALTLIADILDLTGEPARG